MNIRILSISLALVMGLSIQAQTVTPVRGTRVGLETPEGFTAAARFPGFISESTGASLMVSELPGPVTNIIKGYTKAGLARQGMSLLNQEAATFGNTTGMLFSVSQPVQNRVFQKWIGVFGEPQPTFVVTATFPKDLNDKLSGVLKNAVLSARVVAERADPMTTLSYSVTPAFDLKVARVSGSSVVLSRGGNFPIKELEHPMLVVTTSASKDPGAPNRLAFTMARLRSTASLTNIVSQPPAEVLVDGLPGYEIVSQANHRTSGRKAVLYQVILFEPLDYYLMQGIAAEQDQEAYVPAFRMVATSFKRKGVHLPADGPPRVSPR